MVFSFMMSMIKCELTTADVALIRKEEHTHAFNGPFSGTTRVSNNNNNNNDRLTAFDPGQPG